MSSGVICVRISAKLAPALHPNLKPPNRQTNLREIIDSGLQGPQDRRVRRWRHRLPPAPEPQTCSAAAQRKRYRRLPPLSDPHRANSGSRNNGENMYTKLSAHTSKAAKYDDFWSSSRPFTYPSGKTRLLSVRNYCCSVYSRLEIKIIENKNYISDGKK